MDNSPESKSIKHSRFRWLPRAFLLSAALVPIGYTIFYHLAIKLVGPEHWDWEGLVIVGLFLAIAITAWFLPITGGVIAIIVVPIGWFWIVLMLAASGTSLDGGELLVLESVLLVIGGVLSIIWGIRRTR